MNDLFLVIEANFYDKMKILRIAGSESWTEASRMQFLQIVLHSKLFLEMKSFKDFKENLKKNPNIS